jgi:YbbR domain-containing protein
VVFQGEAEPLTARADEYSLEDVVTHVLRNAERYRVTGQRRLSITLEGSATGATIAIRNLGPQIAH